MNFFASWCVYCNEELPGFVQVAKATDGTVAFVGVNTSDPGDGAAMARRFDLAGAGFALAKDVGGNPPSQLWSSFGSQGLPVTAFYDATGKLVDFAGGMLTQAELEQRLKTNFGIGVTAPNADQLGSPVIPLIPQGAYELLRTHPNDPSFVPIDLRSAADFAQGHLSGAVNIEITGGDVAAPSPHSTRRPATSSTTPPAPARRQWPTRCTPPASSTSTRSRVGRRVDPAGPAHDDVAAGLAPATNGPAGTKRAAAGVGRLVRFRERPAPRRNRGVDGRRPRLLVRPPGPAGLR